MRGLFALSGLVVLMAASFASPVLADGNNTAAAPVTHQDCYENGQMVACPTATPSPTSHGDCYENGTFVPCPAASTAPSGSSAPTAKPAPPSDDCRGLSEAAHAKVREFLDRQRADVEALLAKHEAHHKAFHEANVSDADDKAFHERQASEWASFKNEQSAALDKATIEVWRSYRERCERPAEAQPAASARDVPAECRDRWQELERLMVDLKHKWAARHQEFQQHFDAARAEFRKAEHSDADWKAFEEKWAGEARALYSAMEADMKAAAEKANLLKCWLAFHSNAEKPVPSYVDKREASKTSYDEGARRIMERCQAKMEALKAEYAQNYESKEVRTEYETYPERSTAYPTKPAPSYTVRPEPAEPRPAVEPRDGGEFRERMMKLKAACEAEMKAYMEKKHSEGRDGFGSFVMREEDGKIIVEGKYLSMVGLPERQMMTEIAVNKKVLIDALFANGFLAEFRPEQTEHGSAIMVFDAAGYQILGVHDNPRGVIKLSTSSEIDSLTLDLNDNLELAQDDEGIRFAYGDWKGALLVHKGSVEIGEGNVLTIHGKATFLVTNAYREKETLGEKYNDAVLKKKVGAEVTVAKDGTADTTPLTDLEVKDTKLVGSKLSARIDAPDGEGKTVVFKVAAGLFKCDGLRVKLFAVNEDGTESSLEIAEADDLEDVLDPNDDGPDGFEYWCVSDKDGQQILVSIAHFSEKRVEVESAGVIGLPVVPGFETVVLLAAAGLALVVVGMRRRL